MFGKILLAIIDSGVNLQHPDLTTGQCNFRCVYCYESFIDGEMSLQNQANIIDFVQKNIQYYSALEVGWFGGEPLCGMNVIKNLAEAFMDICKKNGKPYIAHITTNGYLLTLPVLQQLKNGMFCDIRLR